MSKTEWVIEDAFFGKIKDINIPENVLKYFIKKVIDKHPNSSILLRNLSDLIVLVAWTGSEKLNRNGEKYWKDILNEKQYGDLQKYGQFIIGWMLVNERYSGNANIHYIDLIDTLVPKYNLAKFMIDKYENINSVILLPQEIIESSALYWAKYFEVIEDGKVQKHLIDNKINGYIDEYSLDHTDLKWEPLFELCNTDLSELKTKHKKRKRNN